jgi:hypothetical protein
MRSSCPGIFLGTRSLGSGKITTVNVTASNWPGQRSTSNGGRMILSRLGQGGMGQVFKAVHRRMERIVALKMLAPELVRTPDSLRRFQQEVKVHRDVKPANLIVECGDLSPRFVSPGAPELPAGAPRQGQRAATSRRTPRGTSRFWTWAWHISTRAAAGRTN